MSVNVQPTVTEDGQFLGGPGGGEEKPDDAENRTMMININGSLALLHSKGHTAATFNISPEVGSSPQPHGARMPLART